MSNGEHKDAHRAAQPSRTFTEIARRAQIVEAAIATIAEAGYQHACGSKRRRLDRLDCAPT